MATAIHAKKFAEAFNSVTICSANFSLDIAADAAETTTSCDTAKTFAQGKYGWTASDGGTTDFADNGQDETIFTAVTGGGASTLSFKANGDASTSATNPSYSGSAFVTSYSIAADIGSAVQASTSFQGTGALARAVA